jgi:hypothetical protein
MSITTEQYINLIGSETDTLSKTVSVHLIHTDNSLNSITMQAFGLYFESKQLIKSIKKIEAAVIIDADNTLTDFLMLCQEKIKNTYQQMQTFINNNFSPLNKVLLKLSCFLLKKTFDNYKMAICYISEHDVDARPLAYSPPFNNIDDLMKHLNS